MDAKAEYRNLVSNMGKKEFTFLKMQEYGFWPSNLPNERQEHETEQDFENRKRLLDEFQKLSEQLSNAYQEKAEIEKKLSHLKKEYQDTWDYEKIRSVVAQEIMKESLARRAERKAERERQKQLKKQAWNKRKAENILFIGKGYSNLLAKKETNVQKLKENQMPVIETDRELAVRPYTALYVAWYITETSLHLITTIVLRFRKKVVGHVISPHRKHS